MKARALPWLGACVLLLGSVAEPSEATAVHASGLSVNIRVDTKMFQRPISPEIYGVSFATAVQLSDLNIPLNRSGGNHTSRYNWQLNASNRGADWYFQSVPEARRHAGRRGGCLHRREPRALARSR